MWVAITSIGFGVAIGLSLFSVVIDCLWTWTRERFGWVNASSPPINTLDPESDMGISRSVRVSPPWYCFQYNG